MRGTDLHHFRRAGEMLFVPDGRKSLMITLLHNAGESNLQSHEWWRISIRVYNQLRAVVGGMITVCSRRTHTRHTRGAAHCAFCVSCLLMCSVYVRYVDECGEAEGNRV